MRAKHVRIGDYVAVVKGSYAGRVGHVKGALFLSGGEFYKVRLRAYGGHEMEDVLLMPREFQKSGWLWRFFMLRNEGYTPASKLSIIFDGPSYVNVPADRPWERNCE